MARRKYWAIIDTETTIESTIADVAIVICDRHGKIYKSMAVLIKGEFDAKELFYDPKDNGFWGKEAAKKRKANYVKMLNEGTRMLASVSAVNRWIDAAIAQYQPELTAFNLPYDRDKCIRTNIDLSGFPSSFDLWGAACGNICVTKGYKQFCLENHQFTNRTEYGNMTMRTNAETVFGYLHGQLIDEPHTALEDLAFEVPILTKVLSSKNWRDKAQAFNWREFQVKNHFVAK